MPDEKDREKKEEQASMPNVKIGGGVGGNVEVAGRDIVHGDVVSGDKVGGDKISVGDISGSKGVAIGRNAHVEINEGVDPSAMADALVRMMAELRALEGADQQDIEDAKAIVEEIKEEGDEVEEKFVARRLRNIARMGPDILKVVTATLVNPAAGFAEVVRLIAQKVREEEGLDPA